METNSQDKADESEKMMPDLDLEPYDLQMGSYGGDNTESPATTADRHIVDKLIAEARKRTTPVKKGYKERPDGSFRFTDD